MEVWVEEVYSAAGLAVHGTRGTNDEASSFHSWHSRSCLHDNFGWPANPGASAKLARGKYLVENIGRWGDCHTPHNEKGEPIKEQWLKGAALPFKPAVPMPVWAEKSVNIAGLPGWEKEAAVKFFMTGIAYNDLPARPPMPQYRCTRADAEAVVAHLKSLGGRK